MRIAPIVVALILATAPLSFATAATNAMVESKPGEVSIGQTATVTGRISAIDAETREVTLTTSDGEETVVKCGPEVKNFAQLNVGDAVDMQYTESLALELKKGSTAEVSRTVEGAQTAAEPGASPGGAAGIRVHIIAEVMAVNAETQTVTLRGPEHTIDLQVNDPKQFENIAVGDRIEATYIEALAVQVTPAKTTE